MSGPVVGVAGAGYIVQRFWGELPVRGVPTTYVDAIAAAGGRPVILPPGHANELLDVVDAVVLAGGDDIGVDPPRDRAEIALVRACRSRGIPLMGVCRGLQLLAVADGGSLLDDLGADRPHVQPDAGHQVRTSPGSTLWSLLGAEAAVSSLHHQAVARPGSGWLPTCRTADGCIEALEWVAPGCWPALGVQWHPELDSTGPALFGWLVAAAYSSGSSPSTVHEPLAARWTLPPQSSDPHSIIASASSPDVGDVQRATPAPSRVSGNSLNHPPPTLGGD